MTTFFGEPDTALSASTSCARSGRTITVIAGSYEADAKTIARDVIRALARLRIDALGVMLLFWVRSRARLSDEAFECLSRLKEQGRCGRSASRRTSARSRRRRSPPPWDMVMCRHSAAHPGIESEVLPIARARGVGLISFSALVYGRMLLPDATGAPVRAADCYRYSLSQPGIDACISAPRRPRELEENLAVLRAPPLDEDPRADCARTARGSAMTIARSCRSCAGRERPHGPRTVSPLRCCAVTIPGTSRACAARRAGEARRGRARSRAAVVADLGAVELELLELR